MPGASFRIVVLALHAGGVLTVDIHRRVLLEHRRWAATAARAGYRRRRGSWVAASHQPSSPPTTRPTSGALLPGLLGGDQLADDGADRHQAEHEQILMSAHLRAGDAG